MKFGEKLFEDAVPEWKEYYLSYDVLKKLIKKLEEFQQFALINTENTTMTTSLTVPLPTNRAGMPDFSTKQATQEEFFVTLESEMRKIEQFTKKQVQQIRAVMERIEAQVGSANLSDDHVIQELRGQVDEVGESFLKLEKYVNLNFTGFHKILKKHDRRLPNNPCKSFYVARLHDQSWVRGDYSDVIVSMSRVYSVLRGDDKVVENKESEAQNFVRSTRKYWVHTEDISQVKYTVLQHLPVFLQTKMAGETDSQLVNSVYLDNHAMELYHGRLEKSPGAIALRMRWYGTGTPETVFVERKTHRESWAGELSVKERFIIPERQVQSLIKGTFDIEAEVARLQQKGKSETAIAEWRTLASEVVQAINSKQLFPTLRTQYMRTAFQIPFDATVRISLDTNLTMISERTDEVAHGLRWFRDPNSAVPADEITRFPHSVLEIKLQLQDEGQTPAWVSELLSSGKLLEVHKFSKFIHGSAVLLPEDVRDFPYWIDDATLAPSIIASGGAKLLQGSEGANAIYEHLLPHDKAGKPKRREREHAATKTREDGGASAGGGGDVATGYQYSACEQGFWKGRAHTEAGEEEGEGDESEVVDNDCWAVPLGWCESSAAWEAEHMTTQKVEPKIFFANERTFIKWMEMAVILSSISTGILAFTKSESSTQGVALFFLPLALLIIGYGLRQFYWRNDLIRARSSARWDDVYGPVVLTSFLIAGLLAQFVLTIKDVISKDEQLL